MIALIACSSTTSSNEAISVPTSVKVITPSPCDGGNCPIRVPDCGNDPEVHATFDVVPGTVGQKDVEADLQSWINDLFGAGTGRGIPTPEDSIAFQVTNQGKDLGLLWYRDDGNGGWIRKSYVVCQSALKPS